MVGMFLSGIISRYLMPRFSFKAIINIGLLMIIPCVVSLLILFHSTADHTHWFFITTALLFLFSGAIYPSASHLASNAIPDKASAASMMSFINMGSAMISVVLLGYLPFSSLMAFIITITVFFVLASLMAIRFIDES